jgi:hypothetical protein
MTKTNRYDVRTGSQGPGATVVVSEMNLTRDRQDLTDIKGEALGTLKVTVKIPGEEQLPGEYTLALRDERQRLVEFQAGPPSGEVTFEALKAGKYGIVFLAPGKR